MHLTSTVLFGGMKGGKLKVKTFPYGRKSLQLVGTKLAFVILLTTRWSPPQKAHRELTTTGDPLMS